MNRKILWAAAFAAPAILLFAQAPKPAAKSTKAAAPKAAAGPKADEITGKITFAGTPPKAKALKMDADPVCAKAHPDPVMSEDTLVNADGGLQNVLVYVKAGLPATGLPPTPTTPIKIEQKGCIYSPRLVVAMVGQPLQFTNDDATDHHIQAMAEVNKEWSVTQNKGAGAQTKKFDQEEIGMLVICHLHPWMKMFVSVLKNPYYAVTAKDGTFTIKGLPAGYYTLEAWHEKLGTKTMKAQAGSKADFTFKEN